MAMSLAQEEEVISDPENDKETDIEEENINQTAICIVGRTGEVRLFFLLIEYLI